MDVLSAFHAISSTFALLGWLFIALALVRYFSDRPARPLVVFAVFMFAMHFAFKDVLPQWLAVTL